MRRRCSRGQQQSRQVVKLNRRVDTMYIYLSYRRHLCRSPCRFREAACVIPLLVDDQVQSAQMYLYDEYREEIHINGTLRIDMGQGSAVLVQVFSIHVLYVLVGHSVTVCVFINSCPS